MPERLCSHTSECLLFPCLFSFLFNGRPLYILKTKIKGPVERGKPKMGGVGGDVTVVLRSGRGLDTLRVTGSLQLLTSIFSAKSKARAGARGLGRLLRE